MSKSRASKAPRLTHGRDILTSLILVQRRGAVCDWRNAEGCATVIYVAYGHMIIVAATDCEWTIEM